jgi:hypothetical protein
VSTNKSNQRGKKWEELGLKERREKIKKMWHNLITAALTLIGGFFFGEWVAKKQTAKKKSEILLSNVKVHTPLPATASDETEVKP